MRKYLDNLGFNQHRHLCTDGKFYSIDKENQGITGLQHPDKRALSCRSTVNTISRFNSGFTLVELLVVLSIVAILTLIGVPSYISFITANNILAESTALLGDLQYARSQAIKQGYPVSICAANTSGTVGSYACNGSTNWKNGWITYTGNTTTTIAAANVLRIQQPLTTSDTLNSSSTTAAFQWCFNNFGFPSINYNAATNQCVPSANKGSVTVAPGSGSVTSQTVCVSAVGSMQSVAGSNSLCP